MTPTLPDLDWLLALCEAAPDDVAIVKFVNGSEGVTSGSAKTFYDEWRKHGPTLIAHLKSETARADEAERDEKETWEEKHALTEKLERAEAELIKLRRALDVKVGEPTDEHACWAEHELREARGEVTDHMVSTFLEVLCLKLSRKRVKEALSAAIAIEEEPVPEADAGSVETISDALRSWFAIHEWDCESNQGEAWTGDVGVDLDALARFVLPHLVPDRGEMPKQRVSDEHLKEIVRNGIIYSDLCRELASDAIDLRRAWAKQQDASPTHVFSYSDGKGGVVERPVRLNLQDASRDVRAEALDAIQAERRRQIDSEGWSAEHDDAHDDGSLLRAAVIYLHWDSPIHKPPIVRSGGDAGVPMGWPWDARWWKPKDRRSNLVRAGALCLAEKDRCRRAGLNTKPAEHKLDLVLRALIDKQQKGGDAELCEGSTTSTTATSVCSKASRGGVSAGDKPTPQQDAGGESAWRPIETAPKNRDVWTFTRTKLYGQEIVQKARWNRTLWIDADTRSTIYPHFWFDGKFVLPPPPTQEPRR